MWKCNFNESMTELCRNLGYNNNIKFGGFINGDICDECERWHNSDTGINYMKKFKENRKKEERRIEIEKLKKLAYLT